MKKNRFSTKPKAIIDENYYAGNIIIRWLVNRLLKKISILLIKINAAAKLGLDVGCGEGNIIYYLHKRGTIKNIVAVDLNKEKLNFANKHYPVCNYLNANVDNLVFKNNSFGYIIATEMFEHLDNPTSAIKEIQRVAETGAYLIISIPYEPFFHWGNLIRGKYWNRGGKTPAHVNFWNRVEFKEFLRRHNILIEEEYSLSVFPWLLFMGRFK